MAASSLLPPFSTPLHSLLLLLITLLVALPTIAPSIAPSPPNSTPFALELQALLQFRASADILSSNRQLRSWSPTANHCSGSWYGIRCGKNGRVTHLVLDGLQLSGPIDSLRQLQQLRVVSLCNNRLNGSLVSVLSNWRMIKSLYLCRNFFAGPLPDDLLSPLSRLVRLDISDNRLSGPFPASLASLPRLLTISLQNNLLYGSLPNFTASSNLQRFNVSGNRLSGAVPVSLSNFPISSFLGNDGLCGLPLLVCPSPSAPLPPGSGSSGAAASTLPTPTPETPSNSTTVKSSIKLRVGTIAAIVVGQIAIMVLITWFVALYYCRRFARPEVPETARRMNSTTRKKARKSKETDQKLLSNYPVPEGVPEKARRLVFVDGEGSNNWKRFELDDLLRASAEMMGKGTYGTAYKAILSDNRVVAVKRMNESMGVCRKDFAQAMAMAAKLRHRNLVQIRAYCFGKEEKLLVYDYMPAGNLHTLLHGNRGPARTPLDWTTRLKIASGAARGLTFIHHQSKAQKLVHGNIKSSNVLLDKDGNACISDFGLVHMANSCGLVLRSNGYRAPECVESKKISQAGDVYSFGVVLLEILTGKLPTQSHALDEGVNLPRWVQSVVQEQWTSEVFDLELLRYKDIEEEMVALLQIAMACVATAPEHRPRMSEVTKMIEGIFGEHQSFQRGESFDSISMSPSISEDTTTSH